jgi:hypothetical protein
LPTPGRAGPGGAGAPAWRRHPDPRMAPAAGVLAVREPRGRFRAHWGGGSGPNLTARTGRSSAARLSINCLGPHIQTRPRERERCGRARATDALVSCRSSGRYRDRMTHFSSRILRPGSEGGLPSASLPGYPVNLTKPTALRCTGPTTRIARAKKGACSRVSYGLPHPSVGPRQSGKGSSKIALPGTQM